MELTPQDKAKELVSKFTFLSYPESNMKFYNPKQCALIAVDALISETYAYFSDRKSYWQQVKQEINNL